MSTLWFPVSGLGEEQKNSKRLTDIYQDTQLLID